VLPLKTNLSTPAGIMLPEDNILFSIDLMGTLLEFELPGRTLEDSDFLRGPPVDLRPYVNTLARTEYRYTPPNNRGSCEFFESGWYFYTKKWWEKKNQGMLKLLVSLETPRTDELDIFPDLFIENQLKEWLSIYYRDRQLIKNRTSFSSAESRDIEITFHNEKDAPVISPEDVPLNKWPEEISGMPCYFIYLNPGIIEFNLPISHRDVLQFRFQLRYLLDDIKIKQQLNPLALNFSQKLIKTVSISLSDRETERKNTKPVIPSIKADI